MKDEKDFKGYKSTPEFMTVKEVASAIGASYDTVNNSVERLFPEIIRNGVKTVLNEYQVACINKELKSNNAVTDRVTFEVSSKVKNSTTDLEIIGNAISAFTQLQELYVRKEAEYKATIQSQKEQLIEQQPKVEFYDDVTGSKDTIDMKEVAKILNTKNVGRNKLFEILRNRHILDRCNQPYQRYVDAGYFRTRSEGLEKIFFVKFRPAIRIAGKTDFSGSLAEQGA